MIRVAIPGELDAKQGGESSNTKGVKNLKSIPGIQDELKHLYRQTIYWFGVLHLVFISLLGAIFLV